MKITFEGKTYSDVLDQMTDMIQSLMVGSLKINSKSVSENANKTGIPSAAPATFEGPGPDTAAVNPVPKINGLGTSPVQPVDKPVNKSKPVKPPPTAKQLAAVEKMRAAKEAKKAAAAPKQTTVEDLLAKAEAEEAAQPELDPAEVVKLRQKTIEDLQQAYADGHQKEVFELLSRFGNGAKSFRELPADAFVPIRRAIDNGALT
jgi:hypothetical protein